MKIINKDKAPSYKKRKVKYLDLFIQYKNKFKINKLGINQNKDCTL